MLTNIKTAREAILLKLFPFFNLLHHLFLLFSLNEISKQDIKSSLHYEIKLN